MAKIDIYPVGWLCALRSVIRTRRVRHLRIQWRYTINRIKRRDWRAVHNSLNGYLAEADGLPINCGTGWTKARAMRDLKRIARKSGVEL